MIARASLVDRARISLEEPDLPPVPAALGYEGHADLLKELRPLAHLAHLQRVGPQLVKRHSWVLFRQVRPSFDHA